MLAEYKPLWSLLEVPSCYRMEKLEQVCVKASQVFKILQKGDVFSVICKMYLF